MLYPIQITRMHDQSTLRWHQECTPPGETAPSGPIAHLPDDAGRASTSPDIVMQVALAHHRANYDLWHEEDKARDPEASDAVIAQVKHAIDALNQLRNDLVEKLDRMLLAAAGEQNAAAPLHSESPGLILDRLSILALKLYHTSEESRRASATEAHRARNLDRLSLLEEQRTDLADCLETLWKQVLAGECRFKLYRQMKMYNDPELNPAVYSHHIDEAKQPAPAQQG